MYADDVVIFLSPQQQDLVLTRGILEIFFLVLRALEQTCRNA